MSFYDYECNSCGHKFEVKQSIKDDPLKDCPECGGEVKRLISPNVNFLFKGSGFYITDYRSDEYKKEAKAESGEKDVAATTTKKDKADKKDKKSPSEPEKSTASENKSKTD